MFVAAADFYRQTPWRCIPADSIIEIECDSIDSGPWFAVVMGQSGVTLGLVLYEDLDLVRRLFKGTISDEDIARRTSAVSMTYGEPFELAAKDLDAVEQHGWPIAGPEAYPFVMRVNPGQAVRVPLRWEVALLTGCLEVIPQFINEERTAQVYTTSSTVEPLTLKLTLLEDDTPAD